MKSQFHHPSAIRWIRLIHLSQQDPKPKKENMNQLVQNFPKTKIFRWSFELNAQQIV